MRESGERVRMGFIEREIADVNRKLDQLLREDRNFERRIQRLEDMKIEGTLISLQARLIQLQKDAEARKVSEATKKWFWAKVISIAAGSSGIVVYLLDKFLI